MTRLAKDTGRTIGMNKGNHGAGTALLEHIRLGEDENMETMERSYRQATPKEKQHLLNHIFVGFADDEIKLVYSTEACGKDCTFPHTVVTLTVCPKQPCPFPINPGPGQ